MVKDRTRPFDALIGSVLILLSILQFFLWLGEVDRGHPRSFTSSNVWLGLALVGTIAGFGIFKRHWLGFVAAVLIGGLYLLGLVSTFTWLGLAILSPYLVVLVYAIGRLQGLFRRNQG